MTHNFFSRNTIIKDDAQLLLLRDCYSDVTLPPCYDQRIQVTAASCASRCLSGSWCESSTKVRMFLFAVVKIRYLFSREFF